MARLGGRVIRRRGIHVTVGDVFELGDLKLQCGATLHTARLAYQTHRRLNTAADNAVGIVFEVDARVAFRPFDHACIDGDARMAATATARSRP